MSEKKKFLLRLDENIHAALEKWAADDFRSINAQIEYLLSESLKKAGRYKISSEPKDPNNISSNQINSDQPEKT